MSELEPRTMKPPTLPQPKPTSERRRPLLPRADAASGRLVASIGKDQ